MPWRTEWASNRQGWQSDSFTSQWEVLAVIFSKEHQCSTQQQLGKVPGWSESCCYAWFRPDMTIFQLWIVSWPSDDHLRSLFLADFTFSSRNIFYVKWDLLIFSFNQDKVNVSSFCLGLKEGMLVNVSFCYVKQCWLASLQLTRMRDGQKYDFQPQTNYNWFNFTK